MKPWLSIVGIGAEGIDALSPAAQTLIDNAEILIGGTRHLAMIPAEHPAERRGWTSPISDTVSAMKLLEGRRVVVLATGDPMSYGIGVTLGRAFGREAMTVLPVPGAFSLAAARLGWALQETDCLTLHGRPLETLNLFVRPGARLLILSEDGDTPAQVAQTLCNRGYGPSHITVLSEMGAQGESIRTGIAETWDDTPAPDLNTIAVDCTAGDNALIYSRVSGLPDDAFRNDGQLTKRVVRAATLSALAPQPRELLWDVGAGCGSIAIEWMRAGGRAIAIENRADRSNLIAHNAAMLGTPKLDIITGKAPEALSDLPQPHAIFVGGGLSDPTLAEACWARLPSRGRLLANVVTLEGEAALLALHAKWGGTLTRIASSEAVPVGRLNGWQPMRTVTQIAVVKP